MMPAETKHQIEGCLQAFQGKPLHEAAIALLNKLGYRSEKTLEMGNAPEDFLAQFDSRDRKLRRDKALFDQWKSIDFLFQITDDEVRDAGMQGSLGFDSGYDPRNYQSYLFFALDLEQGQYARTQLSDITREINLLFGMPAMLLIRHGGTLTLSVIDRRPGKRDESRDVLEKVKLIKDIRCEAPHRAHIEILYDLSLPVLIAKHACTNFLELHKAWRQTLDSDALNKRFYRELADWYFWALDHVQFPDDVEKDAATRNATSVIRLLTRLIFCWFLKEKGLLSPELFSEKKLQGVLKSMADDESSFYQAILQNLFFATLNQKMNTGGEINRKFAADAGFKANKNEYGVKTLYRYQNLFAVSEAEAIKLFEDIPFLNGGLFDCLDKEDDSDKKKVLYVDGFTRNPRKQPKVPNFLFFSDYRTLDLSDAYGDKKKKCEKVRGLINLLDSYKFTITENTPIEEEIALDPELLGKVFENLLASYNPETGTTARKQTGSFYTPREIVNYMVDESLIAYLEAQLKARVPKLADMEDLQSLLREVFAYTEKDHPFNAEEVDALIAAIDECKILDPACGSGAFPMGILHKLVFILGKLDPHNELWKQKQMDKLDSVSMREELERTFRDNDDDYGRKLFLIENCIYGVDIQPIAIQISKLRFFISLICDQRTNKNKAKNCGIRPLPNLETKFVAANTLLPLKKSQTLFRNPEIDKKEKQMEALRKRYFSAQSRRKKLKLQEEDRRLRRDIFQLLKSDGWDDSAAHNIADWNPYDQNSSAGFFDTEWMFGEAGFNVVLGNPPYGRVLDKDLKRQYDTLYLHQNYQKDLFLLFMEKVAGLLHKGGIFSFIVSNTWLLSVTYKAIRKYMRHQYHWGRFLVVQDDIFTAIVDTHAFVFKMGGNLKSTSIDAITHGAIIPLHKISASNIPGDGSPANILAGDDEHELIRKIRRLSCQLTGLADVYNGVKPFEKGKGNPPQTAQIMKNKPFVKSGAKPTGPSWRPLLRGSLIERYRVRWENNYWIKYGSWLAAPRDSKIFDVPEKICVRQTGDSIIGARVKKGIIARNNLHVILPHKQGHHLLYLLGVLNSKLTDFVYEYLNPEKGEVLAEIKKAHVEQLLIPKPSAMEEQDVAKLVQGIESRKLEDAGVDTSELEQNIDNILYKICELTESEIAVVEGRK